MPVQRDTEGRLGTHAAIDQVHAVDESSQSVEPVDGQVDEDRRLAVPAHDASVTTPSARPARVKASTLRRSRPAASDQRSAMRCAPPRRFTLPEDNEQIVAARYQLYLPTEEELRAELAREREEAERVLRLVGSDGEPGMALAEAAVRVSTDAMVVGGRGTRARRRACGAGFDRGRAVAASSAVAGVRVTWRGRACPTVGTGVCCRAHWRRSVSMPHERRRRVLHARRRARPGSSGPRSADVLAGR